LRGGTLGFCAVVVATFLYGCASSAGATSVVDRYLAAWSSRNYSDMEKLVSNPPADFVSFNRAVAAGLDADSASYRLRSLSTNGSSAIASVTERVVTALGPASLGVRLALEDSDGSWRVVWSPANLVPGLKTGDSVVQKVSWPARAQILGAGDAPLTTQVQMVEVGVEGSRVTDPASLTSALLQAGATAAQVQSALTTATSHPQWFVPVLELSQPDYERLRPVVYPVPGTVFEDISQRAPVTPGLTQVVGTVGPVTAQQLRQLGTPYKAGDTVGQTGIEEAYERQLAGKPGGSIDVVSSSGDVVRTVARFKARAGTPVRTTIDPAVESAAQNALANVSQPAAIVAVRPSTGEVLASVTSPASGAFDDALAGAFPPGSTFKVITSADLIEHGLGPGSPASCPATITVGGETFHNFEGEAAASLTLEQAFAESCNAAFIGLAGSLPYSSFSTTASQFGLGARLHMGLSAFGGSVPTPTSDSERAATAIGQGKVLVSPLDMADVAASVESGSFRAPRLVDGAADDAASPTPLDSTVVRDLQEMMTAVVDSPIGTAAGAGLPSGTSGKTGTAEFGDANPPQTHAWFIGYRADLAFAVLVVGGGIGGAVAAPIAAKFLDAVG
jgi:cell division protein FtsI/penicillin-binding protein 2